MINFIHVQIKAQRKFFEDKNLLHKCHNSLKRIHRAKQALKFIQSCTEKKVYPKFVTISTSQLQKICLTKLEIRRSQALFVTSLICLIF